MKYVEAKEGSEKTPIYAIRGIRVKEEVKEERKEIYAIQHIRVKEEVKEERKQ